MSINKLVLTSTAVFAFLISGSFLTYASPIFGATLTGISSAKHSFLTENLQAGQSFWTEQRDAKIINVRGRRVGMRSSFNRRTIARSRVRHGHRGRTRVVRHARRTVVVGARGGRYVGYPRSYRRGYRLPRRPAIRRVYVPSLARGRTVYIYPRVYGVRYRLRRCYHPQIRRYYFARDCRIVVKRVWFR